MSELKGPNSRELVRYAMRRLRRNHREEAEDLVQEVYLRSRVWQPHPHVEHELKWLYGTAKHILYDLDNEKPFENTLLVYDNDAVDTAAPVAPDEIGRADTLRDLEKLLDLLPPRHREIIVLHKIEGYSYEEVAELLDLSIHTVEKYITHALQQLRGKTTVREIEARYGEKLKRLNAHKRAEREKARAEREQEASRLRAKKREERLAAKAQRKEMKAVKAVEVAARKLARAAKKEAKALERANRVPAIKRRRARKKRQVVQPVDERYLALKEKYPTVEFYP